MSDTSDSPAGDLERVWGSASGDLPGWSMDVNREEMESED